ncbi:hypothetical protein ACLOJK_008127 [Asimina triloba]
MAGGGCKKSVEMQAVLMVVGVVLVCSIAVSSVKLAAAAAVPQDNAIGYGALGKDRDISAGKTPDQPVHEYQRGCEVMEGCRGSK